VPEGNAVKTQIWIAVSVYVLVAIIRKRLTLEISLYQILQILSVTLFEKRPFYRHFSPTIPNTTYPILLTNSFCSTCNRTAVNCFDIWRDFDFTLAVHGESKTVNKGDYYV